MTRNQRYAEHMARLVAGEFAQDVSLLVAYGSFVTGGQSAVSDVDLYFVPATGRALALSRTFWIEDVGYDLFPMDWERLERIADFSDNLTPLVAEARVLYCRGAADAARFADLQAALRRNLSDSAHMLRAARQRVDEAYAHFGRLCAEEDVGRARYWAGALLMQCSDAFALK